TTGRYAQEFESGLAAYVGTKYAMLTNSGSSANLLALTALTLAVTARLWRTGCGSTRDADA
ncbi:MAG: DegT/DnrJ/EryC1/StrS family aminotransferase, partial [Actinobacteria bacterium]|nr:DegT/DnrJ/EryC1/StrS family aminotransferase [Actinomycetota bacterium]